MKIEKKRKRTTLTGGDVANPDGDLEEDRFSGLLCGSFIMAWDSWMTLERRVILYKLM